jgi:altronate dehydratase large subunit
MVGRFDILPILRVLGNSYDFLESGDVFDINAGTIIDGTESINAVGRRIYSQLLNAASGGRVKAEYMRKDYIEPLKIYSQRPII